MGESMSCTTWLSSQPARILREPGDIEERRRRVVVSLSWSLALQFGKRHQNLRLSLAQRNLD